MNFPIQHYDFHIFGIALELFPRGIYIWNFHDIKNSMTNFHVE